MFMQDITRLDSTPLGPFGLLSMSCSAGLVASTLVETAAGWRPAGDLRIGDSVFTLDGGLRPVRALDRREIEAGSALVRIAGGHFGACSDLLLMPGQGVVLDTLGLHESPFVSTPAAGLAAFPGAGRTTNPRRLEIVTPIFAEEEAVWAHSGVLLACPGLAGEGGAFPALDAATAGHFLARRARRLA